ncbi:MAG: 4-alpha-glucanotransferase, partial [Acidimicrobiales bacterium]
YRADQGDPLQRYATFCALAEVHGPRGRDWPADVRHPGNPDVGRFAAHRAERVDFHCWLQWLIDTQLARAGSTIALVADLAVGADPEGADAWLWQDWLAPGVTVGAPADEFNQRGQDWALPPFDPWKLRAARYEPFIQALRAGFRHAGGLRVDHVMGLFRLFWVPAGASPSEGTYVRYPWRELLDLVALESQRAGAYVVGEDLGNVEDATRAALAEAAVLSYRLAWFEPGPPATFPPLALGALGTHDLPTVAGLWTGADLDAQRRFGMTTNPGATRSLIDRIAGWTGLVPGESPAGEVVRRTYGLLAEAPCALLAASLDDVLEVAERPNYPGTVVPEDWSSALPLALEAIVADPRPAEVARILSRR